MKTLTEQPGVSLVGMLATCRQQAGQLRRLSRLANLRESGEIALSASALFQAALVIENLCNAREKAQENTERLERSESQLIEERDSAEDALSKMFEVITGEPPQWSNAFGFDEALEIVEMHINKPGVNAHGE